jgi:uncharacterized radical SAM superfamily Fe-S cluster-containing enzyme
MYIKITNRCNMNCSFCVADAKGINNGLDMYEGVFKKALQTCMSIKSPLLLGGGEPTIVPNLWRFIDLSMDTGLPISITTNGKDTLNALRLADLAEQGLIRVILSLDEFHEPIDSIVEEAFAFSNNPNNSKFIRRTKLENIIKKGRSQTGIENVCSQPNYYMDIEGFIYACGCENSPIVGIAGDLVLKRYSCPNPLYKYFGADPAVVL